MFRILTITIILAATVNSEPLSCYFCVGSLTSDCFNGVESSMVIMECADVSKNFPLHNTVANQTAANLNEKDDSIETKCVSYTSKFANNGEHFIERGCGYIYVNVDICEYIEAVDPNYPINNCAWCSTELCNVDVF